MCGIAGIVGAGWTMKDLEAMVNSQRHRGPDSQGYYRSPRGNVGLGHNRLSILDLSYAGQQPMSDPSGRYHIVFNGEVYNYLELRSELCTYPYHSATDTEVLLAAYIQWGEKCLNRLLGMFAFAVWDEKEQTLFAARDRFGVKPFYYCTRSGEDLLFASEIKGLHAAGVRREPDTTTWATYLATGFYDHTDRTFWKGIRSLPGGHVLRWQEGIMRINRWYDLAEHVGCTFDARPLKIAQEEYLTLLKESVQLRFRSDVPVGINLSGGVDSSILLGLVQMVQGADSDVAAFTFVTGDPKYDELPWVEKMILHTCHRSVVCRLDAADVPNLAQSVTDYQDEPFGGLPTLAYARLFERARAEGTIVLLDGFGMDEQWAGYDYYANKRLDGSMTLSLPGIPGSVVRPDCLIPEFRSQAEVCLPPRPFPDSLRNLQLRDAVSTKIPRALRFNDRISMRSGTELREPFLDHRLFELALRQPRARKISNGQGKVFLRGLAKQMLPETIVEAPKRFLQTPHREWIQGPLRHWAHDMIQSALSGCGSSWLDGKKVASAWSEYVENDPPGPGFHIWQWIGLGMMQSRAVSDT